MTPSWCARCTATLFTLFQVNMLPQMPHSCNTINPFFPCSFPDPLQECYGKALERDFTLFLNPLLECYREAPQRNSRNNPFYAMHYPHVLRQCNYVTYVNIEVHLDTTCSWIFTDLFGDQTLTDTGLDRKH